LVAGIEKIRRKDLFSGWFLEHYVGYKMLIAFWDDKTDDNLPGMDCFLSITNIMFVDSDNCVREAVKWVLTITI
jgi:hypothetical protein